MYFYIIYIFRLLTLPDFSLSTSSVLQLQNATQIKLDGNERAATRKEREREKTIMSG